MMLKPKRKRLWPMMIGIVMLAAHGCVPGVQWLPDSSGFMFMTSGEFYGAKSGRLMHYDLKAGVRQVAETGTNTICPAVSPDGRRVAVARLISTSAKPQRIQIIVYDLKGNELHRSNEFEWPAWGRLFVTGGIDPKEKMQTQTQLYWSATSKRLLVYGNGTTGIYVPGQKNFVKVWQKAVPLAFGNTPVRPDGKGFLIGHANTGRRGVSKVAFADWHGRERSITMAPHTLDGGRSTILTWPMLGWSNWTGQVAVVTTETYRIRIDTERLKGEPVKFDRKEVVVSEIETQKDQFTFPELGTKVSVFQRRLKDAGLPPFRVEVSGPEPTQRKTLVHNAALCLLFPSPDKKFVAIRCWGIPDDPQDLRVKFNSDREMIFIVNHKGQVIEKIVVDR